MSAHERDAVPHRAACLWLVFSGGGVMAAIFLPVLVFLFALAFPLGWIDPPDHDHLAAVVGHPLTFLVLLGCSC